jgi:selenium metabolism protein YedF
MKTVLVLNSDQMGHGDEQLGGRILQTMLNKASALRDLDAILFYNGGAKLAAEGSACLQALAALEQNGVDLIVCGTCVDHYGLRETIKVGHIGSMDDILAAMNAAGKVITL